MNGSGSKLGMPQTEFRLIKPMPSQAQPEGAPKPGGYVPGERDDSLILRLFPSQDIPDDKIPAVNGIIIGHFRIEERIGRGGMGSVFRAVDLRLDREVALKVLSPRQLSEPGAIQRFQNEARAAAKLDHENIARVFYIGEDHGIYFIAFEYIHGTTVRDIILREGPLTIDESVNYALQTAEALKHTASAGLIHRDIKPSNLIVTPSGRVKLVDLGLVRNTDPNADDDLTVSGTTLGTFDYISPEQARDPKNVDVRSDIYSLGCTLFHMVTGQPPYPHGTSIDKLLQHSSGKIPDPAELNPRVAPQLSMVIQRMMALEPDDRQSDPQEVIDDLSQIAIGLGLRATAPEGTIWRKPIYGAGYSFWEENRNWILAFALIVAVAIGADRIHALYHSVFDEDQPWGSDLLAIAAQQEPASPLTLPDMADADSSEAAGTKQGLDSNQTPSSSPKETISAEFVPAAGAIAKSITASVKGHLSTSPEADVASESDPPKSTAEDGSSGKRLIMLSQQVLESIPKQIPSSATAETASDESASTAPLNDVFVLYELDGDPVRFHSLESACAAAATDSVILIDHDGPFPSPQHGIVVRNKRLTIRPVPGKRPELTFLPPAESLTAETVQGITVSQGSLDIYDVDIRMKIPQTAFPDFWSLFSLDHTRRLKLERVTVTFDNPGGHTACFVERREAESSPARMMPQTGVMAECEIDLRDCLLRGDGTAFVDRSLTPASYRLEQVAVAVTGSVFSFEGTDPVEMANAARHEVSVQCELKHVTLLSDSPVLQINTGGYRECPDLDVQCRYSLIEIANQEEPLIRLEGHQDNDLLLNQIRWEGEYNILVGHLPEKAIVVHGLLPNAIDDGQVLSLDSWWQQQWESADEIARNRSVLLPPGQSWSPFQLVSPQALSLTSDSREPRAPDDRNRGFNAEISKLPQASVAARSSSAVDEPAPAAQDR